MITIKLFGDKQGERFAWSIEVVDSRGIRLRWSRVDDTEQDAKACMHAALGGLVGKLQFVPVEKTQEANETETPVRCICLPDRMTLSEPPQPRLGRRDPACRATTHCTKRPL